MKRWGCYKEIDKGGRVLLEGRRDWETGRGRSGKLRRTMGKMRMKVIFNPSSSAMYMPVFAKFCLSVLSSSLKKVKVGLVLVHMGA